MPVSFQSLSLDSFRCAPLKESHRPKQKRARLVSEGPEGKLHLNLRLVTYSPSERRGNEINGPWVRLGGLRRDQREMKREERDAFAGTETV